MERIVTVNLTDESIKSEDYVFDSTMDYGRGLAARLIYENVPVEAGRYSPENALVLVPGILTGSHSPSACRITVAAKRDFGGGIQVCNTTGDIPQKLASLGVSALVVKGAYEKGNAVIVIDEGKVQILHMPELGAAGSVKSVIRKLRDAFGEDAAVFGVSRAGEMRMSLATFFCTYPQGNPEFHCPRSGFGDIPGSKGLRAIVVKNNKFFGRYCQDEETLLNHGRELANMIVSDPICGNALPGYGSATIMKILKSNKEIVPVSQEKRNQTHVTGRINYCCAPMCVVGCLNRHSQSGGEQFESPDQSEVLDALVRCFGISQMSAAKEIQQRANDLGIVGTEFVTAANVYFKAIDEDGSFEKLKGLLDEIEKGSLAGRLVASRTTGIYSIYQDKKELSRMLDRKAIDDEQDFEVIIKEYMKEFPDMTQTEMLYTQIFVLENLGICLFTSFALLNHKRAMELMAQLLTSRTGIKMTDLDLLRYARRCISLELDYERKCADASIRLNVPPFTKVLYRYFGRQKQTI